MTRGQRSFRLLELLDAACYVQWPCSWFEHLKVFSICCVIWGFSLGVWENWGQFSVGEDASRQAGGHGTSLERQRKISNKYKNKLCNISTNGNTKHNLKYKVFWQATHLSTISYMHSISLHNLTAYAVLYVYNCKTIYWFPELYNKKKHSQNYIFTF